MQNKYQINKGKQIVKRILAEEWYARELQKSIKEFKEIIKKYEYNANS